MKIIIKNITLPQAAMIDMAINQIRRKYEIPDNTGQVVDVEVELGHNSANLLLTTMSDPKFIGVPIRDIPTGKGAVEAGIREDRIKPLRLYGETSPNSGSIKSGLGPKSMSDKLKEKVDKTL